MMNKEIQDMCYAAFDGSISVEERARLEEWLTERPENRTEYDRLIEECLYVRWAQQERAIDMDASKRAIREGMARRERKRFRLRAGISTAAAVAAVVALWFAVSDKGSVQEGAGLMSTRATLVLSDGTEVEVGEMEGQIVEKDGWRITATADGELEYEQIDAQVSEGATPIYNRIKVPRGGEYHLKLGDGTEVWINSDSELEYPMEFSADAREAILHGEAYFKVQHDSEKPFIVRSGDFSMRVYGTEFNLNTYSPQRLELVLVEGSVGFTGRPGMEERMLAPSHMAVIDPATGEAGGSEVYTRQWVAWKDSELIFRDELLGSIIEKLERMYDVNVVYENDAAQSMRFNLNMPRYENITSLFYYLEKTSDVRFRLDGRTVYISMKK